MGGRVTDSADYFLNYSGGYIQLEQLDDFSESPEGETQIVTTTAGAIGTKRVKGGYPCTATARRLRRGDPAEIDWDALVRTQEYVYLIIDYGDGKDIYYGPVSKAGTENDNAGELTRPVEFAFIDKETVR